MLAHLSSAKKQARDALAAEQAASAALDAARVEVKQLGAKIAELKHQQAERETRAASEAASAEQQRVEALRAAEAEAARSHDDLARFREEHAAR